MDRLRIVLTVADPSRAADADLARMKNARYVEAVERAGAISLALDEGASVEIRRAAFSAMDGLLLTGGADLDPARYGEPLDGSRGIETGRDALEEVAYRAAMDADVPVLGVCRGMQMLNVLAGGSLVQHIEGHESLPYPSPEVTRHPLGLVTGTRFAMIVGESGGMQVNSYHHQAVTPDRVAPGLRIAATAPHPKVGLLVEALESGDPDRWLIGVQCHPERTESSPPVLERLWTAFVAACAQGRARSGIP
ncbi:MAG: gamma-glutamyl-gamma-aminobutyrate hydrolase family protein [Chloroflexota bacterium]|nr:gamma-glutamyl-gamma-aminobutyrate hydrolase family protein [Chloroflexota bacterium]